MSETKPHNKQFGQSVRAGEGENAGQKPIVALIYDFDGTLCPRPMQEYAFLPQIGADPKEFWEEVGEFSREHKAEPLIAYMRLMYQKAKEKKLEFRRDDLVAQGETIEFFKGVESWFALMNDYVKNRAPDVELRHYLVSAGLLEIVEGTSIHKHFHNCFASEYMFEPYEMPYPKRVITDTSKTQYLFRINKGVEDLNQSINSHMPENERPIPFSHMIYFGDGETDVPSMAVTRKNGGAAIAVHSPGESEDKCKALYEAGRVDFYAPADYQEGSKLHHRTKLLLERILTNIDIMREQGTLA